MPRRRLIGAGVYVSKPTRDQCDAPIRSAVRRIAISQIAISHPVIRMTI
jgi:hypothetical protein